MEQLQISFDGGNLTGSGSDIIGPFTLKGSLDNDQVVIVKQYVGQHHVDYIGMYDGEGTMRGLWSIAGFGGDWLIKIVARTATDEAAIQEIRPL
jgi:hypothetical protein